MEAILQDSELSLSVIINILMFLGAILICACGFCLGFSIRKQENRIENLSLVVNRHDKEIRELRNKVNKITSAPSLIRHMRRLFNRQKTK